MRFSDFSPPFSRRRQGWNALFLGCARFLAGASGIKSSIYAHFILTSFVRATKTTASHHDLYLIHPNATPCDLIDATTWLPASIPLNLKTKLLFWSLFDRWIFFTTASKCFTRSDHDLRSQSPLSGIYHASYQIYMKPKPSAIFPNQP